MNLVQFMAPGVRQRAVGISRDGIVWQLEDASSVRNLALDAISCGAPLCDLVRSLKIVAEHQFMHLRAERLLLCPIDHPDPAHMLVSGTGFTHLRSALSRDAMHAQHDPAQLTDSMKLYRLGEVAGKPSDGRIPVQPEWFYKGDGSTVARPEEVLHDPPFGESSGEEAELAALYVIGPSGTPHRVGVALGNEFSDHSMERRNYLYLAHSKLRPSSFGPEVWIADIPDEVVGQVKIRRNGTILWQSEFRTGEKHMNYFIQGLELHHFKYAQFRRPGDVHVHFLGASSLSVTDGIVLQQDDMIEIFAPPFSQPLRNVVHDGRQPLPR